MSYIIGDLFTRLDAARDVLEYKLQAWSVTHAVILELNNAICRPVARQRHIAVTPRCLHSQTKHQTHCIIANTEQYLN